MQQIKPLNELLQDQADDDVINEAVEDAINIACERIQSHLGVTTGDFAGLHFHTGSPAWQEVRRTFAEYLQAERKDAAS